MTDDRARGCSAVPVLWGSESVTRHPSPVLVLDSAIVSDFYAMRAEWTFEDLMVHLLEPKNDLLREERGGREAEDREVHPNLSEEPTQ